MGTRLRVQVLERRTHRPLRDDFAQVRVHPASQQGQRLLELLVERPANQLVAAAERVAARCRHVSQRLSEQQVVAVEVKVVVEPRVLDEAHAHPHLPLAAERNTTRRVRTRVRPSALVKHKVRIGRETDIILLAYGPTANNTQRLKKSRLQLIVIITSNYMWHVRELQIIITTCSSVLDPSQTFLFWHAYRDLIRRVGMQDTEVWHRCSWLH